jgi:hypothetical protein
MPLYVQNGKLLKKAGTLGTSAGCCCRACPCGQKKDSTGACIACGVKLTCGLRGHVVAEWEGITLPDDGCPSWSAGGGGGPVYVLALGNIPGYYTHVPGGFVVVDGVCYLQGRVGTLTVPDTYENSGECRAVAIAWLWSIEWPSCESMMPGTHSASVSFFSGENQFWSPTFPEFVTLASADDGCFAVTPPAVTLVFPP